jgi:DNA-directed RNA polymerase specialized sigma24 family protein
LKTFEEKIDVVNTEIAKRRGRWKLKAIPSIDYDDVSQILKLHIWVKWNQWDQTRPLEPWLNKIITNQITNLIRNLYGNFARPCISCPANEGDDRCRIYIKQCSLCPLYAHWEKHKKSAHDTKLPLPLESHAQEVYNIPESSYDIGKQVELLHIKMKEKLNIVQYKIYKYLYIEGKTEEQTAQLMGYKTSEKNRDVGYKTISNIKKTILKIAKKTIEKDL